MDHTTPILIAMPGLNDLFFKRTVVLLTEQEKTGSMGFVITMDTGKTLHDIISQVEPNKRLSKDFPIMLGGPVKTDFFWVIHAPCDLNFKSTIKAFDHMHVTSGHEILPMYVDNRKLKLFCVGVGYAGWENDQLASEIKSGSWWETSVSLNELFKTPVKDRWETNFTNLGVDINRFYDRPDDLIN